MTIPGDYLDITGTGRNARPPADVPSHPQGNSLNELDYRSPDNPSCYRPPAPDHQPQDR